MPSEVHRGVSLAVQKWMKSDFSSVYDYCSQCFLGNIAVFISSGQDVLQNRRLLGASWRVRFCILHGNGWGFEQLFPSYAADLLLINFVVSVIKTEMSIQSQVPVCSQWGGLLFFILASFKYFLNSSASCSWHLFSFYNCIF